ncbi:MAG TPA: cyclic nucleotide-binding domain-containing protein, partial [Bdellovibrio sp.]|nr:cyclic nucleotide-binding domain-containing protein [Bdellovibrio sp.]
MNNIENKLKNLTAFEMCPADLFREIEDKTCLMALSPRGVLAKSGDPVAEVYIVLYGTIKLQDRLSSKKSVIYSFLSRGDFFGAFLDLRNYNVYPCDAVAVDDCGVLKIPVAVFQKLIKVHPPILQSIWQQMNDQLHD